MDYLKWTLAVCLIFGLINSGRSAPSEIDNSPKTRNEDDDYLDDNEDIYDENYDDKSEGGDEAPSIDNNDTTMDPPYFEISEMHMNAMPGEEVTLNCDVRNFQLKNVVMWYKNTNLIVNGMVPLDKRIMAMKNNSIKISDIQESDAGDYYCSVLPENIRLHISLNVGGRLAIFCDGRDVTDKHATFRQGESHKFECKTYVAGEKTIRWSLNGFRAETVATKVDGGKMFIDNIDAEHAGVYQCLGDDGSNDPPHGMVTIAVHYTPKVSTHRHHVNTEPGGKAELYCDYRADPIAIAQWKKNGQYLKSFSEKYSVQSTTHNNRNRTILTVNDVDSSDLGEYECHVKNSIGSNEVKVHLIYEPEHPQFEEMKINGRRVTLYWLVRSMQPLSEAILDYKIDGSYTWSSESMIQTQKHSEHTGIWKLRHDIELVPGLWHARVKTKNTVGWSKFSAQHDFKISDSDDNEDGENFDNPILPPDSVVKVANIGGIGMKEESPSGAPKIAKLQSTFFVSILLITLIQCFITAL